MEPRDSRPRLNTGLRPVWRDPSTLQLGLDPDRAVVVEGIDAATARFLLELDGTRSEAEVLADAAASGLDIATATTLLAGLRRHRFVTDGYPVALAGVGGPDVAGRVAPDHASLSLLHPGDGAEAILRGRRGAAVVVHGAGRVSVTLAALLGAAGVGHVSVLDEGTVAPGDCCPGGLLPGDTHRRRGEAAADAVRRHAPEVATAPLPASRYPDLVVLAEAPAPGSPLVSALTCAGIPHLVVGVRETTSVVGPLVVPGRSSCLRCADLHRCERDPAWPVVAAQLCTPRRGVTEPCDVVLALLTAAVGAAQALTLLEGGEPDTLDGTLELALPGWRIRRRTWHPHPQCDCGATGRSLRAS